MGESEKGSSEPFFLLRQSLESVTGDCLKNVYDNETKDVKCSSCAQTVNATGNETFFVEFKKKLLVVTSTNELLEDQG